MSKKLNELIKELGKIVDGNQSIVEELDKLKSLYEQLKLETAEEFEYLLKQEKSIGVLALMEVFFEMFGILLWFHTTDILKVMSSKLNRKQKKNEIDVSC